MADIYYEEGAPSASSLDMLRRHGLSDRDAASLALGKPVTVLASQHQQAKIMKERLLGDPVWRDAYLAGGRKEAAELMEINVRLSATVVPDAGV